MIHFEMAGNSFRASYDSIAFLIANPDNANLLLAVHSAEQFFITAVDGLKHRNEAYLNLHAKAELGEMDSQGKCTLKVKDPRILKLLQDTTDSLYNSVDNACERLGKQIAELSKAGKVLYPKKNYLQVTEDAAKKADFASITHSLKTL